ncbi:hypothetical protein EJB05_40553, partial [Eragrostis curvula]
MGAEGCGSGSRGQSTFPWPDAVRYVVATVVTVLIVAVIANAIKVVLRPDSLRLWIVEGSVSSTRVPGKKAVTLGANLRAWNPSGRARMYFLDITAYIFDNKTLQATATPEEDCIILFHPTDIAVAQQSVVETITQVNGTNDESTMDPDYFDMLYEERGVIRDAAMRVVGTLVTEVRSGINRTRPGTTYYCWPLVLGGSPGDKASSSAGQDMRCTESADIQ